ncbi:MAG: hypothetical protein KDD42_02175, partial [Bdellovibrionales bacterium]|nr:hypothetical protein [Bdellovibrionales bacterium]
LVFAALLLTPLLGFGIGLSLGVSPLIDYSVYLGLLLFWIVAYGKVSKNRSLKEYVKRGSALIAFSAMYGVTSYYCQRWPDFIAMGERLRDYAILQSVINNPIRLAEPWLAGAELNYYAYWYRLGAAFSRMLGLPVWQCYHALIAFSLSFFFAVLFRIFQKHLNFSSLGATLAGLLISLGSNLQGMIFFFSKGDNWWAPSRVIPGAINEFPAWSFVLGDLHPHYLNLGLIPFFVLILLNLRRDGRVQLLRATPEQLLMGIALVLIPPIWLRASNAWEIPIWLGFLIVFVALGLFSGRGHLLKAFAKVRPLWPDLFQLRIALQSLLLVASLACFYLSALNFDPGEGNEISLVYPPVQPSLTFDLLRHWGAPLLLIGLANLVLIRSWSIRIISCAMLIGALLFPNAMVVLTLLLFINLLRYLHLVRFDSLRAKRVGFSALVIEAVGVAALGLILLPEVAFVNDAYGGENERMNTIFKIYSSCWFMLHMFAFYLSRQAYLRVRGESWHPAPLAVAQVFFCIAMLGFFHRASSMRSINDHHIEPRAEGLSEPDRHHPGAAAAIRALRNEPHGVVLEAQGNAYSYTSFVSSLAGQQSYLGWSNHVNLLVRSYDEVGRRERITDQVYQGKDCVAIKEILEQEGISYLVWGTLERRRYPQSNENDFKCLDRIISAQDYRVFRVN